MDKNNYQQKQLSSVVMVLLIIVLLCITVVKTPSVAYAADGETAAVFSYSSVLDDLNKDPSFDEEDYPSIDTDYSLNLIQIAESSDAELFVYVYQPAGDKVKASSINISTSADKIDYKHYKLKLISKHGTLFKYKVVDLLVKDTTKRYYAITSIYRPFNIRYDEQTTGGNTIDEISYDVSQQYELGAHNGQPYIDRVDIETIVVTDKFVGYVRYEDGFSLFSAGACDSHFVAFSTNKQIDKLLEADVYYVKQKFNKSVWFHSVGFNETFGDVTEDYAYLQYTQKRTYEGKGIGGATYEWNRIESVESFLQNIGNKQTIYSGATIDVSAGVKLTDDALAEIENKQWVLRFAETPLNVEVYAEGMLISGLLIFETVEQTFVGQVTILRLKFETEGIVYNLGVIDNVQTGSSEPAGTTQHDADFVLDDKINGALNSAKSAIKQWLEENKNYIIPISIAIICFVIFCIILSLVVKLRTLKTYQSKSKFKALKHENVVLKSKYETKKHTTSTQVGRSKK